MKILCDKLYADYIDDVEAIYLGKEKDISNPWLKGHEGSSSDHYATVQTSDVIGRGNDTPDSAVTSGSSLSCGNDSAASAATASSVSTLLSSPADSSRTERETESAGVFAGDLGIHHVHSIHTPLNINARQKLNSPGSDETGLYDSQSSTKCATLLPKAVIDSSPASTNKSLTPSLTEESKVHCTQCKTTFTGTRQHRESNLKRHMNDKHKQIQLDCTECDKKFGRTDSRRRHRLSAHGIDDPPVRPNSISRRQRKSFNRKSRAPTSSTGTESLW